MLDRVAAAQTRDVRLELVIVNDGSTDQSPELIREWIGTHPEVQTICIDKENGGKGSAVKRAIPVTTGEAVIIQDADLEYDPNEYPLLAEPVFNGEADVVYGSRFLNQKRKGYLKNILANRFLTALSNFFTKEKLTDMETCYKCFRKEIIQSIVLEEDRFGFEPEVTAKIARKGIRIKEVPISYHPRTNEEGKKIGFKDGLRAIYVIWKYRKMR
jgi:glycosyltransferase involved in cell wall biosynthesis